MAAIVLVLWMITAIVPAAAQGGDLAGMQFTLPEGWSRTPSSEGALTLRRNLPAGGSALIAIAAPRPLAGTSFDDAFSAFTRLSSFPEGRPLTTRRGVTVNGHPMMRIQRCCRTTNRQYGEAHFIGIDSPRGAVFLTLVMIGMRREETTPLEAEFDALARSLRPSPTDRALDFKPTPGVDGIEGAYTTLSSGIRPNVFGGTDFYAETELMLFEPGGLYARAVPTGEADLSTFCRRQPRSCGFWRLTGGPSPMLVTQSVRSDDGMIEQRERPFSRDGEALVIGRERWRAVQPFSAGARLDGHWRYFYASSGQTAFTIGGVSGERLLTLSPDGRFIRSGYAGMSSSTEAGGTRTGVVSGQRRPVIAGTYWLEGYRLTLTAEDGQMETLSILRPDGSDRILVINGSNYLRRDAAPPRPAK